MSRLTVVAKIVAVEGKRDLVKAELLKLIAPTRIEEGCVNYDLHQDNKDQNVFWFHENWESKALLQQHLASTHISGYLEATDGAVQEFEINEMTQIG